MITKENQVLLPCCYSEWLDCFDTIQSGGMTDEQIFSLKKGTCGDFYVASEYFYEKLENTVNFILNKSIKAFNRNIEMYRLYTNTDGLHLQFRRLIKSSEKCLFFTELEFLPEEYRRELFENVKSEMKRFLDTACNSLYKQCLQDNNTELYDEIRLIKNIRVYTEWEKIGL